ncbi:MAG: MgtC/SapB family protein [Streptosporangiaceae bacterium]
MIHLTWIEIILRVLLALGAAAVIGLERELASQPAGLRTHVLLGLGAALFALAGLEVMHADLSRIAAQVASGVGFLGAGAILQDRQRVRGLTTAASLWVTAAIGVAAGIGAYVGVGVVTIFALVVLTILKWIEREFFPRRRGQSLSVAFTRDIGLEGALDDVRRVVGPVDLRQVTPAPDGGHRLVGSIRMLKGRDLVAVAEELRSLPGVTGVSLER